MRSLEERVAALETVAKRCQIPYCDGIAKDGLCLAHDEAWKKYMGANRADGAKFGGWGWMQVYYRWLESVK